MRIQVSWSIVKTFSSVRTLSHRTGLSSLDYIHILNDFFFPLRLQNTEIYSHNGPIMFTLHLENKCILFFALFLKITYHTSIPKIVIMNLVRKP